MITPEHTSRKLDSLGRITLPKGLRDRLTLFENDELELFTANIEGRQYILLSRPVSEEEKCKAAAKILLDAGYDIPDLDNLLNA